MKKISIVLLTLIVLSGCKNEKLSKYKADKSEIVSELVFELISNEVELANIEEINKDTIENIVVEKLLENNIDTFLYTIKNDREGIYGGLKIGNQYYNIGQIAMNNTTNDLIGIDKVQVFGKKAVKFYGILGANYGQAYYCFFEDILNISVIQVDGNMEEIDLDNDGKNEIVSTLGTIPQTKIYKMEDNTVLVSDINISINAEAIMLEDKENKIFTVYLHKDKPEYFRYENNSFKYVR